MVRGDKCFNTSGGLDFFLQRTMRTNEQNPTKATVASKAGQDTALAPQGRRGKPKKSEDINVSRFNVTTEWVSVKINASHVSVKLCSMPANGLLHVASDEVMLLSRQVLRHSYDRGSGTKRNPEEIIREMGGGSRRGAQFMFLGSTPGQKLMPVELRMEAIYWDWVKAAAAALDVSVAVFCQEALRQRAVQIADYNHTTRTP